jgi:polysaccharide pyruvyl transferase WcaK-like protein
MNGIPTVALITTDKFNHLYKRLGIQKFIIHHTNAKLFESLEYFSEFPRLDTDKLYESSTRSLNQLKFAIDALP